MLSAASSCSCSCSCSCSARPPSSALRPASRFGARAGCTAFGMRTGRSSALRDTSPICTTVCQSNSVRISGAGRPDQSSALSQTRSAVENANAPSILTRANLRPSSPRNFHVWWYWYISDVKAFAAPARKNDHCAVLEDTLLK